MGRITFHKNDMIGTISGSCFTGTGQTCLVQVHNTPYIYNDPTFAGTACEDITLQLCKFLISCLLPQWNDFRCTFLVQDKTTGSEVKKSQIISFTEGIKCLFASSSLGMT